MKVMAQEEYGLRCLIQLARGYHEDRPVSVLDLAMSEGLSGPFVSRILGALKTGGLVKQVRGVQKGYTLTRNPSAIMLDEVLTVLGGRLFSGAYCDEHGGKRADCVHMTACNVRPVWGSLELVVSALLRRISIDDLLGSEGAIRATFYRSVAAALQESANPVGEPTGVAGAR